VTRDGKLRLVTAAFAVVGIGIASYLSYTHATNAPLMCPTSGCGQVQQSSYSELAGIPVAYLGVAGYGLILATTFTARREAATVGAGLAVVGAAFALYLLVIQLAVIGAVCTWCVSSDAVLLAITSLAAVRVHRADPGLLTKPLRIRDEPAAD
jgi:uncharacterized membrane protein